MITWKPAADYLRCNPSFFGAPRYDGVIIHKAGGRGVPAQYIFAQLIFVFSIVIGEHTYPLALVHPMTQKPARRLDQDLSLYRVRAKLRTEAVFVPVRSIVRGALLYPVPQKAREYYVVDTVDADMFVRVQKIFS